MVRGSDRRRGGELVGTDRDGRAGGCVGASCTGQLVRLRWQGSPLTHILWGPDCYVVPWEDGAVLVGATVEEVGFDERATAAGVRDLLDAVCELLPDAWHASFTEARVGLRPATADGLPIIGRSEAKPATCLRDRPLPKRRSPGAADGAPRRRSDDGCWGGSHPARRQTREMTHRFSGSRVLRFSGSRGIARTLNRRTEPEPRT